MLHPHHVGRVRAARHTMRVLNFGLLRLFWRHIAGDQALAVNLPALAVIARLPPPAAGDRDEHTPRIARVGRDRMDARHIVTAAEPFLALRHVPQRAYEFPRLAAVVGAEQPGGKRPDPD